MIDTRAVAQEVQDQLVAAMHKGQEQIRKGRETVTVAVRTGSQIAQAVKPSLPVPSLRLPSLSELTSADKLRASAHELAGQVLATQRKLTDQAFASQRKLAGHAQDLADHAVATQRKLGGKALEVASPLIVEGVAKLTQVAGTFVPGRRAEQAESVAHAAAEPVVAEATSADILEAPAEPGPAGTATPAADVADVAEATSTDDSTVASATAKAKTTAKTRTAKAAATAAKPAKAKGAGTASTRTTKN